MGQMWGSSRLMILSLWFLHIPTDTYISLLDWIAHLRSWNMLEIVGISFLCLMSWSDLDGFVEQAGQQLWVCGSYTFKHFEPSIYSIYHYISIIHYYIQRRYKVRTWTSHNFHWWIVMSVPIIIFAACILKFACHISQLWVGDPSLRAATGADSHVFREACGFTATPPGRCGVDVGAHGFCWEFGQQEPARKWTRIHNRKLTHGRVWKCGVTWYNPRSWRHLFTWTLYCSGS